MRDNVGESKSAPSRSSVNGRASEAGWLERSGSFDPGPDVPATRVTRLGLVKTVGGGFGAVSLLSLTAQLDQKSRISRPYEESGWVHACLKPIGQAVASVPLEFWDSDPTLNKGAKRLPPTDPIVRLFRAPSPIHTGSQFFESGALHRKLDGEDFWFLLGKDGKPVTPGAGLRIEVPAYILNARGSTVGMRLDTANGWPAEWRVRLSAGRELLATPDAVLHFRDYNPDNPLRGLGDIETALSDIDLEWQATRYQRAVIKNSGDPGGTVIMEGTALAPPEKEALDKEVQEQFGVQNAGRWRLLPGRGVKYEPNKLSPRDMDFAKMLAWIRDKIAAICGIPLPVIGVLDHATLNNFSQAVEMFWKGGNGILTYLASVEDVINNRFLPRLARPDADRIVARFDLSGIKALQDDRTLQWEIATRIAQAGIGISFAEAAKLVGLEIEEKEMPLAGVRLSPMGLVPTERLLEEPDEEEDEDEEDGEEEPDPPEDDPPEDPDDEDEPDEEPPAEEPSDEDKAAHARAQVEAKAAADAEAAAQSRRDYWDVKEVRLLREGEARIKRKYRRWRESYERAQFKRLRDYAAEGPYGLRGGKHVTKDDLGGAPVTQDEIDVLLLELEEWRKKMADAVGLPIKGLFENALEDIAEELDIDFPLNGSDPRVIELLETQILRLTEGHTSTLADQVRDVLTESLSEATSTGSLQTRLEEVLPELEGSLKQAFTDRAQRAQTIARTETAKAVNKARTMGMHEAGVTSHEWITSKDAAVRGTPGGPYEDSEYSHYDLDGKEVELGKEFADRLKFPGDPDAPAGQVCNCRCLSRPIVRKSPGQSGDEEDGS